MTLNEYWVWVLVASVFFVSALVYASNNSNANLSKLSCNIKETVNEFVFKGAAVKEVVFADSVCSNSLGGVVVTHVIYLNANQNDFLKATVLRHEYCHWLRGDSQDSFWEEAECYVAEFNPLNYLS